MERVTTQSDRSSAVPPDPQVQCCRCPRHPWGEQNSGRPPLPNIEIGGRGGGKSPGGGGDHGQMTSVAGVRKFLPSTVVESRNHGLAIAPELYSAIVSQPFSARRRMCCSKRCSEYSWCASSLSGSHVDACSLQHLVRMSLRGTDYVSETHAWCSAPRKTEAGSLLLIYSRL